MRASNGRKVAKRSGGKGRGRREVYKLVHVTKITMTRVKKMDLLPR